MPNEGAGSALGLLPLWAAFLLLVVLVACCLEFGFRIGRWRRSKRSSERDSTVGAIATAMVGLLGFMLAFTFGIALSRFESRQHAVLDEANAIGTAYLRAQFLAPAEEEAARKLLREYVDVRLRATEPKELREGILRSEAIHVDLWKLTERVADQDPRSVPTGLFVESVNAVIDAHTSRLTVGGHMYVPGVVWAALLALNAFSMWSIGYYIGVSEKSRSLLFISLALSFSLVLYLIADLDRPQEGAIRASQWPLESLRRTM